MHFNGLEHKVNIYKKTKAAVSCMFVVLSCFIFTLFYPANANANDRVYSNKYAAFVMDANTGLVLHRHNAGKKLHPASLTKIMTLYMLFDALERGEVHMNSRIYVSAHAASMEPSKLGLEPGSAIRVQDAIYALVTKSANDVAVAVAEKLGKTESNFAKMMTAKARTLGMSRTTFRNASGLHDPRQVSTARDMTKLAQAVMVKYPKYYKFFSKKTFRYKGKTYRSHNKLMDSYVGMDGMKTGYIRASGFNLVSSAVRNNTRLIGVVFGGKTAKSRNLQMEILLDNAFERMGELTVANASVPIPMRKPLRAEEYELAAANEAMIEKPSTGKTIDPNRSRWAMLDDAKIFGRTSGQGDYEAVDRSRIEAGLISISAHLNEDIPAQFLNLSKEESLNNQEPSVGKLASIANDDAGVIGEWSIQIGAFSSRESTDKAIIESFKKLPDNLRLGHSTIAPVKTKQGWIFRGRINGYSKTAAHQACDILPDCIALSPKIQ